MTSLNPVMSIGRQITESVALHRGVQGRAARDLAVELLDRVGIPDAAQRARAFPHQLSGGMQQRVMIALALAGDPDVLIADEPTTALDVTVQAQILDLVGELVEQEGLGVLLIAHDLGVVAQAADEVCVMYAGRIVERATVENLFANPLHPYTQGLLKCTARLDDGRRHLEVIPGMVPRPDELPSGCRFHPRCGLAADLAGSADRDWVRVANGRRVPSSCAEGLPGRGHEPPLTKVSAGHWVACWERCLPTVAAEAEKHG
jgi:peptide/nickel transport system ATP-binding protein